MDVTRRPGSPNVWCQFGLLSQSQATQEHTVRPCLNYLPLLGKTVTFGKRPGRPNVIFHSLMLLVQCYLTRTTILITLYFISSADILNTNGKQICRENRVYALWGWGLRMMYSNSLSKPRIRKHGRGKVWSHFYVQHLGQHRRHCTKNYPVRNDRQEPQLEQKSLATESTLCTTWTTTTIGKPALPQIDASTLLNATSKKQNRLLL